MLVPVLDSARIRAQFPELEVEIHGRRLAYLDTAATTLRCERAMQATREFDLTLNANVHRGVHTLSQLATDAYESARQTVADWVGAEAREIVFTKGCTESLNLVASSYGESVLKEGDEVLLSTLEHHANILPWQRACARTGAVIVPIPVTDACEIDMAAFRQMVGPRTKIVGVKHVCNATGTVNPVEEIGEISRSVGATFVVDGAQALAHQKVDVGQIGADFYSMTAHKVYGPMGSGALFGRFGLLEKMPPYQLGGGIIRTVAFEGSTFTDAPERFEPGTPNVGGAIGFAAALDWLGSLDFGEVSAHESELVEAAHRGLASIPGVRVVGQAAEKAGVVSFVAEWAHPHDIGTVLDSHGVAVRAGHHCCMPLMTRLGLSGTVRASFGVYSDFQDIDMMIAGLSEARRIFG